MEPLDDPLMVEAAAWVARLRAGRMPCAPRGGDVLMDRGRLRTMPRCVIQIEHEFVAAHREQLKVIAKLPRPKPQSPGPESEIVPTSGSDVEARVAPASRSDWRKSQIGGSDRSTPETYGPIVGIPATPQPASPTKEPDPEVYVQGYRITDRDVKAMLSTFGDEALAEYEQGHLTKAEAYQQACHFYTRSLRMGIQVAVRGASGRVFLYPELKILRPPRPPSTDC